MRTHWLIMTTFIIELNCQQLLLHQAKTSPVLIPYPGEVSCGINSRNSKWAQISFYYPIHEYFDRPCIMCKAIQRKTECYSNFIGQTTTNTVSEIEETFTPDMQKRVMQYLKDNHESDLNHAQDGGTFEIIPEGYIKCSWLRTIEAIGVVLRCRVTHCKFGRQGLLSPITMSNFQVSDVNGYSSQTTSLYFYAPISDNSHIDCPFSLKGVDYCAIGIHQNSSLETAICTASKTLFQIDFSQSAFVCNISGRAIWLSKTGEYVSRQVVDKATNNVGHELVTTDSKTLLDIRKSVSSLSELNFISNVIQRDTGNQYFLENCLKYKLQWSQWAYGYPSSCLAALDLISTSRYAGCKYHEEGILAYETLPVLVPVSELKYNISTRTLEVLMSGVSFPVIPYIGIIMNKQLSSMSYESWFPRIYPLMNGDYWSPERNIVIHSHHHFDELKLLTKKPEFENSLLNDLLMTVPFSTHSFAIRFSNHTHDYKQEVLPVLLPGFGWISNSILWMIILLVLVFVLVKILSSVIPSFLRVDTYGPAKYV
ncbi:glycoprotein [hymenopteran rhabdo-related virus 24]|uniref:Glycoprotein n=1 Tax=hymenopteran rhabdo-related virus 24 TaxID=2847805 RepID=A0A7U3NUU7_9RHAB|nr:glycoprotein [hymenopteran rhabdo-related virus 24]QPB73982.1 glycoprotein [hymenopteran rhabdo-related virus 24]